MEHFLLYTILKPILDELQVLGHETLEFLFEAAAIVILSWWWFVASPDGDQADEYAHYENDLLQKNSKWHFKDDFHIPSGSDTWVGRK